MSTPPHGPSLSNGPTTSGALSTIRELWRIGWPVILSGLVSIFINGNDAILLVGSSDEVLASATAASAIHMVAVMVVTGLVSASQVLISRAYGAKRYEGVTRSGDAGLWLGLWSGIAAAILVLALGSPLISLLSGEAINGAFAYSYLAICLIALPFTGLSSALRARLSGLGETQGLFGASACAAVVDVGAAITLNYLIGPFGVAIGTVLGSIVTMAILVWFTRHRAPQATGISAPETSALIRINGADLKELLALGWPEAIMFGASAGASVVVAWLLSAGPPAQLAASRILQLTTSSALWIVLAGIGTATTTLLGRAAGAGDAERYRSTLRYTLRFTLTIAGIVLAVGPFVYLPFIGLFSPASVVEASAPVVWLAFAQAPLMAIYAPTSSAVRALKDTRTPMIASIISEYAVFLPLGYLLTRVYSMALTGVFIAHIAFWTASVLIVGARLLIKLRRIKTTAATDPLAARQEL